MHKHERHQLILQQVARRGFVRMDTLQSKTGASLPTVRRDVNELARLGELEHCHGGVRKIPAKQLRGVAFEYGSTVHQKEKRAIARAAAAMCSDGESIIINGGTTTFQMVNFLQTLRLDVLTNSLPIANFLFEHSVSRLHIPGGEIYRDQHLILSPFEDDTIKNFNATRMFIGAQAVSKKGVLEVDPRLIQSELKLMGQADELVLCVDSKKFNLGGSLILAPVERFDTVITDTGIHQADLRFLKDKGIKVILAPVE